jgi:hypothetical protein
LIWANGEAEYFCKWDWTGQIRLTRLNKFRFARKRHSRDGAFLGIVGRSRLIFDAK